MSVGSRIKELRNSLDLTQQKFADRLGIQRGIIGKYEVDVSAPSDAVISLICREFNVREAWLRDGTGERIAPASSATCPKRAPRPRCSRSSTPCARHPNPPSAPRLSSSAMSTNPTTPCKKKKRTEIDLRSLFYVDNVYIM